MKKDPVSEYMAKLGRKGGKAKVPKGTSVLTYEERLERMERSVEVLTGWLLDLCRRDAQRREAIKAGLARAKAAGARVGRPRMALDWERIVRMHAGGCSLREIGKAVGVSYATVARVLETALPLPVKGA